MSLFGRGRAFEIRLLHNFVVREDEQLCSLGDETLIQIALQFHYQIC